MASFNMTGDPVPEQNVEASTSAEPEQGTYTVTEETVIPLNLIEDNIRTQLADFMSGGKATREGLRYVLKSLLLELAEGQLLDCLYENSIYKKMMKENAQEEEHES